MIVVAWGPLKRLRVWVARAHQSIGWAGVAGAAMMLLSIAIAATTWHAQRGWTRMDSVSTARIASVAHHRSSSSPATPPSAPHRIDLPLPSDVPLLLTQMEIAAVGNGLEWRAADYRLTAASDSQPATLEVRCSFKGPYPKLRSMLVQLMSAVPTFMVREFKATRANADGLDVEAKVVLAVFFQDAPGTATDFAKGSQ
jgi:hypothetical protein